MVSSGPIIPRRTVAGMELFRSVAPAAQQAAIDVVRVRRVSRDARIFNQGGSDVRAHVLIEGAVRISQSGGDGSQILVRLIAPGETFGMVAFFTDRRYPADADAMMDSLEASWSEGDLLKLMHAHPQIAVNALKIVGRRLQEAQNRLRELAKQPVEQRIASVMTRLMRQVGHKTDDGIAILFPLRRKDIADICGTTLYSVSRILTTWEKAGWLGSRDKQLTVRRPNKIRRIAENDDQ